jgi:hypothetical protein
MHFQKSGRTLAAALHVQHPEWRPLLILIEAALSEAERPRWTRFVPPLRRSRGEGQPLLDGTVISVAPKLVERWVRHLLALAVAAGTEVQLLPPDGSIRPCFSRRQCPVTSIASTRSHEWKATTAAFFGAWRR